MNFEIILATSNKHKLKEVREILSPHKITVYGLSDLNLTIEYVEENGSTYQDNALMKAREVQKLTKMPIIADDSGLEIISLNHEPGLFSARYASSLGGHQKARETLIKRLESCTDRSALFICDIVLLNVEDKPLFFKGEAKGHIAYQDLGEGGFGYDPIFIEDSTNTSFGMMDSKTKNKCSHRAKALIKLITYLRINGLIP